MWISDDQGNTLFSAGDEAWEKAAAMARACRFFTADDEDEWTADEARSCYNCRYRRWTVETFACMKR